ncbi:DNA polymerase delta, subunit 4-domain-containing protein [Rhizophagus diaphanus]|nr:DNA polymerase delta, subunit 4-domain-containing protein [Rhizophagus diaphanus] [Rhizophagus sp. MUCL 43196]
MPKLKTSEKLVQKKLSGIFTSTKRDKAEKDKDKPKKNQIIEKSKREGPTVVVNEEIPATSIFVEQKNHALDRQSISELDESENEAFDRDDLINEDDVPREASIEFIDLESDPEELLRDIEIRSKLTFHNDDYNPMESLLHAFDLNYKFGSCVGLTRLERWERAQKLGLNPPEEVKNALASEVIRQNLKLNECVFYGRV